MEPLIQFWTLQNYAKVTNILTKLHMFAEIVQLIKYQIQQEELASATQALDMFPLQIQNSSLQKHVFNAQLDRLQTERVLNVPPAVRL